MVDREAAPTPSVATAAHEKAVLSVSQSVYSLFTALCETKSRRTQRDERCAALHLRDNNRCRSTSVARNRSTNYAVHAQFSLPHLFETPEEENRFATEPCRVPAMARVPM